MRRVKGLFFPVFSARIFTKFVKESWCKRHTFNTFFYIFVTLLFAFLSTLFDTFFLIWKMFFKKLSYFWPFIYKMHCSSVMWNALMCGLFFSFFFTFSCLSYIFDTLFFTFFLHFKNTYKMKRMLMWNALVFLHFVTILFAFF